MAVQRYYICDKEECGYTFDLPQKTDEKRLKKCPKCKKMSLYQDLSGAYFAITKEPTTVGHLADRNTKKMGKYELESKRMKDGLDEQVQKREKRQKLKKLSSFTKEQKIKYIQDGE